MAELVGVVSAGAGFCTLALELAKSAVKLRDVLKNAGNAAQTLVDLTFDLQTASSYLAQVERQSNGDDEQAALLHRCLTRCAAHVKKMETLVDKLSAALQRSRLFGKLYVAFKEPEVAKLVQELECTQNAVLRAVNSHMMSTQVKHRDELRSQLQLSHTAQASMFQEIQRIHCLLRSQEDARDNAVSAIASSVPADDEANVAERQRGIPTRSRTKQLPQTWKTQLTFTLRWGDKIYGKRFHIALSQLHGGLNLGIRTWNVRCFASAVFRLCQEGDLLSIQRLLESGEASITDCSPDGSTLLDYAALRSQYDLCRFLLATPSMLQDDVASRALGQYAWSTQSHDLAEAMYRLFLQKTTMETDLHELLRSDLCSAQSAVDWFGFCPTRDCVNMILQEQPSDYLLMPLDDHLEIVLRLLENFRPFYFGPCHPELVPTWLGLSDGLSSSMARYKLASGFSLSHFGARALAIKTCYVLPVSDEGRRFLKNLILLGADITGVWQGRTPFLEYLFAYGITSRAFRNFYDPSKVAYLMWIWESTLIDADVDLSTYCEIEKSIWLQRAQREMKLPSIRMTGGAELVILSPTFEPDRSCLDFEVSLERKVRLYNLGHPPGSWPTNTWLPDIVFWEPNTCEVSEGHWKPLKSITISSPKITKLSVLERLEIYHSTSNNIRDLIDSAQDDHDIISLRFRKRKQIEMPSNRERRPCSAPPPLARKSHSYFHARRSVMRDWLPLWHICPFDSTLRFDCVNQPDHMSVRICLHGKSSNSLNDRTEVCRAYIDLKRGWTTTLRVVKRFNSNR